MLPEEWKTYKPKGKWLFPGGKDEVYLSTLHVKDMFERPTRRTGIGKKVSVHTFRHSFAAHLLEGGTNAR